MLKSHFLVRILRVLQVRLGMLIRIDGFDWIDDIVSSKAELDSSFFIKSNLSSPHTVNQAESLIGNFEDSFCIPVVGCRSGERV